MYIAMNRFKIRLGSEQEFIDIWKNLRNLSRYCPWFPNPLIYCKAHRMMNIHCSHLIQYGTLAKHLKVGLSQNNSAKPMRMRVVTKKSI